MADSSENLMKAPRIRLHFNVHEPIELTEMTMAFQGLGFEYHNYLKSRVKPESNNINDVKLYITKIESNCILAEIATALPMLGALSTVASINDVVGFIKNTSETINWLINVSKGGVLSKDDIPYSKKKVNNIKDIVRLVSKNKNSKLGLSAIKYEEKSGNDESVLEINFTDAECRKAETGAYRALEVLETTEKADREKVLMYFYQTNTDDPKSEGRTGDRACIESISKDPLRVFVLSNLDQQKIRYVLDDKTKNPLLTSFIVDVNIEHDRKGRPRVYRVLKVHEVLYDKE